MTDWLTILAVCIDTAVGIFVVARISGKRAKKEVVATLLDDENEDSVAIRSKLAVAVREEIPSIPEWVGKFDPPAFAETIRASVVASIKGMKGGRPSADVPMAALPVMDGAAPLQLSRDDLEKYQIMSTFLDKEQAGAALAAIHMIERRRRGGREQPERRAPAPANGGARVILSDEAIARLEAAGFRRVTTPDPPAVPAEGSKPTEPVGGT